MILYIILCSIERITFVPLVFVTYDVDSQMWKAAVPESRALQGFKLNHSTK